MTPEQQQRFQEMLQHAMQQNAHNLTPEQMQAMQAAMSRMQQHMGAGGFSHVVIRSPDGTVIHESGEAPPQSGWHQQEAIGPGPQSGWPQQSAMASQSGWPQPGQAQADPYTQRQFEFAVADLKRWLTQYAQYRGQGQFATLEAIFEVAQRLPG